MTPEEYAALLDRLAPDDLLRAAEQAGGIRLWTDDDRKWAKGTLIHEYRERQRHLAMGWKYCPCPQKEPSQMVETAQAKPSALVAHLNANLPAAWAVCALPKPLRRRRYGARLLLGDCHLYVAATRRRVDVLALDSVGIVYFCPNAHPSRLLGLVRDAAGETEKHHPATAPEWAKVPT